MVPIEIVVISALVFLVYRWAKWWARARTLEVENEALKTENAELQGALSTLIDIMVLPQSAPKAMHDAVAAARIALTTTQRRRPKVGDDIKWP